MSTILSATVASTTLAVTLLSCRLDDAQIIDAGAKFRYSRDGSLYGWKRSTVEALTLEFGDMNRPKIQELKTWLDFSASYPVTVTLDNGDIWTGKILNDPFESTHQSHGNSTFTINFEGVKS